MPHLHRMSQTMFGLSGNVWLDLRERIHLGSQNGSQLAAFTCGTMVLLQLSKPQTQRFEKIKMYTSWRSQTAAEGSKGEQNTSTNANIKKKMLMLNVSPIRQPAGFVSVPDDYMEKALLAICTIAILFFLPRK